MEKKIRTKVYYTVLNIDFNLVRSYRQTFRPVLEFHIVRSTVMRYCLSFSVEDGSNVGVCEQWNESYWSVLYSDTVYYAAKGGCKFSVRRGNPRQFFRVVIFTSGFKTWNLGFGILIWGTYRSGQRHRRNLISAEILGLPPANQVDWKFAGGQALLHRRY